MTLRRIGLGLLFISLLAPGAVTAAITSTEIGSISSLIIKQSPQTTVLSSWSTLIQNHAKELTSSDIPGIVLLTLAQAQADANRDLTNLFAQIDANNELKSKLRAAEDALRSDQSRLNSLLSSSSTSKPTSTQIDAASQALLQLGSHLNDLDNQLQQNLSSLSDLSQQQALKLQILVQRIQKLEQAQANIARKLHEAAENLIDKIK